MNLDARITDMFKQKIEACISEMGCDGKVARILSDYATELRMRPGAIEEARRIAGEGFDPSDSVQTRAFLLAQADLMHHDKSHADFVAAVRSDAGSQIACHFKLTNNNFEIPSEMSSAPIIDRHFKDIQNINGFLEFLRGYLIDHVIKEKDRDSIKPADPSSGLRIIE